MKTYAVKNKDEEIVMKSRSGGFFTAISDLFLENGVVYGCVLDNNYKAVHVRTEDKLERDKMRGSKYVQSELGDCFKQVQNDLNNKKNVLFTGTSCQIAGLRIFLQREYTNLLCVDIVCHGVPSPKVWKYYLDWQSRGKTINNVNFRDKIKFGWRDHIETLVIDGKEVNSKVWTNIFYSGYALRPSCYKCIFKSLDHPGDITIADYWNIENAAPEFDDNKGVSLVLLNTELGKLYFDRVKNNIIWKETKIENSMQRAFIRPENMPDDREEFWHDFKYKPFSYIAYKYGGLIPFRKKIYIIVKKIVKRILGRNENER